MDLSAANALDNTTHFPQSTESPYPTYLPMYLSMPRLGAREIYQAVINNNFARCSKLTWCMCSCVRFINYYFISPTTIHPFYIHKQNLILDLSQAQCSGGTTHTLTDRCKSEAGFGLCYWLVGCNTGTYIIISIEPTLSFSWSNAQHVEYTYLPKINIYSRIIQKCMWSKAVQRSGLFKRVVV